MRLVLNDNSNEAAGKADLHQHREDDSVRWRHSEIYMHYYIGWIGRREICCWLWAI